MARYKDSNWNLPDPQVQTWEQAQVAVLMDRRDELRTLNTLLHCHNFTGMPANQAQGASLMRTIKIGLTEAQIADRRRGIGGSDANIILSGDPRALHDLWAIKTGRAQPEDLSGVLPVVLGSWTEELNRYWYERQTGRDVTDEGALARLSEYQAANLDGMTTTQRGHPAIWEGKHVNAFSKIEDVVQRYMPQLHHNMLCAETRYAVISVFLGTQAWECYEVELDPTYADALLHHEAIFWQAVRDDTPPVDLPSVCPPALPTQFRVIDMTGNNAWASHALDWLEHRAAAKAFEAAAKGLKGMIEADVGLAAGHGIQVKRSKTGALSITEIKEAKNAA